MVDIVTIAPDYQRQPAGTPYRLATVRYPGGEIKEARIYANQEYEVYGTTGKSEIANATL